MDEIRRTIYFNPELEAYQGFFDYEWQKAFLEAVRHSKLREPAFDLAQSWEAVSNARQIPWLMVKCLDTKMYRGLDELVPWDNRKISILRDKLVGKIEAKGERLRPMLRKKLQEAIGEIDEDALALRERVRDEVFSRNKDVWGDLIKQRAFCTSLWSSERMCYSALYYAYEWFLTACVGIKRSEPDYRWFQAAVFRRDFESAFGAVLAKDCLDDEEILIARHARNAFAHRGGRIDDKLGALPHTFEIDGDVIQVNALHTSSLYQKLRTRATQLAQTAALLPEFA